MASIHQSVWLLKDVYKLRAGGDWPTYVGVDPRSYGWIGGGENSSASPVLLNRVDRYNYSTDTVDPIQRAELTARKRNLGSVSNITNGWFAGGIAPGSINVIERITYASDTANAVDRCDLTLARQDVQGVGNTVNGWFAGGADTGYVNIIERITYASDTANATDRADLLQRLQAQGGVSNGTYGWFVGGDTGSAPAGGAPFGTTNTIQRYDYAADTTNPSDRSDNTWAGTVVSTIGNGTAAWTFPTSSNGTTFSKFAFASDTTDASARGALLVSINEYVGGLTNNTYGYIAGGASPSQGNVIQRITFATDTANAIDTGADNGAKRGNAAGLTNSGNSF